jgi:hypothetical protein
VGRSEGGLLIAMYIYQRRPRNCRRFRPSCPALSVDLYFDVVTTRRVYSADAAMSQTRLDPTAKPSIETRLRSLDHVFSVCSSFTFSTFVPCNSKPR